MIHKKTFVNANLNASHQLEYAHNLGTQDIVPAWKDENGITRTIGDLFQVIDDNNIILSCNEVISGTHTLYISYDEAGVTASGRRLFELTTTTDPNTTLRLALGKAATPATNITLSALLAWLLTKLGFLKVTSNLSDLNDEAIARSNLNVYSQAQVDALIALKATLYQAGSGGVLGVANTSIFNPTTNYHPATLRNVKNSGIRLLCAAYVTSAGAWSSPKFLNTDQLNIGDLTSERLSTGHYKITHNKGDTNYSVIGTAYGSAQMTVGTTKVNRQANYFEICCGDDSSSNDSDFEFYMFDFFTYTPDE